MNIDLSGFDRLSQRITTFVDADYTPLMEEWERILHEENEAGLKRGEDCDGNPMPPTWRERHDESRWMRGKGGKPFKALGKQEGGTGPPLLPRDTSRAVELAMTRSGRDGSAVWFAALGWPGFATNSGLWIPSLHAHPDADARYPRRDIISRPRPAAIKRARKALRSYVRSLMRK